MRTFQVYNHGRPTTVQLTPPARPLWQGRPIAPEPNGLTGLAMRLEEFSSDGDQDAHRAVD